jgi:FKBP-type peptidyl-prolyl cis-trans isomerase 2
VPGDWISVTVSDDEEPDAEAQEVEMRVTEISPDAIVLDANHPLAGQAVIFDLHVISVRQATAEEIAQRQAEAAAEDAAEDAADGDER